VALDGFKWKRSTPDGVGSIFSTIASVLFGLLVGHANGIHGSGSCIVASLITRTAIEWLQRSAQRLSILRQMPVGS
jgi:hypothetical protein